MARRRRRHRLPRGRLRVGAVLEATDGRGVDVCFDGVGGDVISESLRCLAGGGRHLVIGFASGIEAEEEPMVAAEEEEEEEEEAARSFGNFSIVGVILAYRDTPLAVGFGLQPGAPGCRRRRARAPGGPAR